MRITEGIVRQDTAFCGGDIVNKKWMKQVAALCACAVLIGGHAAVAEERRLGDYIYVPAMQVAPVSGAISLRVEGLSLDAHTGEPVTEHALAGAEFGVYVFSSSSELTPWANPLYPSEPMRIRTGAGETRFSLPQGAEYYLRQESAPQGYIFDDEALIPVTGNEIVVTNSVPGQLIVSAVDTLGMPLSDVEILISGEDGSSYALLTDENGEVVLSAEHAQGFAIAQGALPEGVFAARSVSGGEATQQGAYAFVEPARRTRVTFEHPASGSVLLDMRLAVIDGGAKTVMQPLPGVRMDILSDPAVSIVTDEQGQARASLLEGTYGVKLSYEGDADAVLPLSEGQMIITSGSTTVIELSAIEPTGRIMLQTNAADMLEGGSFTLMSEQTGRKYGPYELDAAGMAVSEPLEAGVYRIAGLETQGGVQFGSVSCEEETVQAAGDLALTVVSGQVTQVDVELLTREKQTFGLVIQSVDEEGMTVQETMEASLSLALVDQQGQEIGAVDSLLGVAAIEALSGEYTLRMSEKDAEKYGVHMDSSAFVLPSSQDTIQFPAESTRMILSSVNEAGEPAAGAVYQLTDSVGTRLDVVCDEDGMAVTPLIAPGEVTIETLDAPTGHAPTQVMHAYASAGEAARVAVMHESLGVAAISVSVKSLDAFGGAQYTPVQNAEIHLYRVWDDGKQTTDTGLVLVSGEDGMAYARLEAGEYAAYVDEQSLAQGVSASQGIRLIMHNTQPTHAELVCLDSLGGVSVRLTGGKLSDDELAQVRFEIEDADGSVTELQANQGTFYAGGLAAGEYILRQTQIPQGYTLAAQRMVELRGGEVTLTDVALEEYAVLNVSKTGLTFDQQLRTYVVPLSGEYGVYTLEDGEMKPYPSEDMQRTLWANVTAQEIALGKAGSAKLPASIEGTTYYLHELTSAPGFAADETYYEVTLRAGEETTLSCAVSSDRGFFALEAIDQATGMHVAGGSFELIDVRNGETVLSFEMNDTPYFNTMAVPVGMYRLRQTAAAPGYALCVPAEADLVVEPYLSEGGQVASVRMTASALPEQSGMSLFGDMYAAEQQGLTLLCVEAGRVSEALYAPSVTIDVGAMGSERTDIASVMLAGVGDAEGGAYKARVEYCLEGGGWQPSDARMTDVLSAPAAVSLSDVHDDIRAVRITYIDAQTGEEKVRSQFTPGQVTLSVEASAQGDVNMLAKAAFEAEFVYQTAFGGKVQHIARTDEAQLPFVMHAAGLFDTVSPGRDGRISGVAFFDEDADGVLDQDETGRYAGMNVSLQTLQGEEIDAKRTGTDGSYTFDAISGGEYVIRFDAGESVVFSSGALLSEHAVSAVEDMRYGTSRALVIDGDHTDYVVHAGCIFASDISGSVLERIDDGEVTGFGGMTVEMRASDSAQDEEPLVVVTGGMGEFSFIRLLPGQYEILMQIPQGYLCAEAQDGVISRQIELRSGESVALDTLLLEKEAAIRGTVYVDDDGDGVIAEDAKTLSGVRVALLRADGAHTQRIAETTTDEYGEYAFEQLYSGDYSVLFELSGDWAFTRYGEDSDVYGAVSQSGATQVFTVQPGENVLNTDAGVTIPARLSISVFEDTQYDGQKGVYEKMLADVRVTLIRRENGQDAEEVTAVTGTSGTVVFDGVSPGEYAISYELPGLWRATRQVESSVYPVSCVPQSRENTGRSNPFTLGMENREEQLYIGAVLSGMISGSVYYDDDADARFDESETACPLTSIELLNAGSQIVASVMPDQNGSYSFDGLAPGRYTVRFTAPQNCGFSGTERTAARGGVMASDSNVSSTRAITVAGGESVTSVDAGVVRLSSISGHVWEDRNADQYPDESESMMASLSVHLMDGAGRNILHTTHTDEMGRFAFDHLKPATYKIRVDAPQGYVFSGELADSVLPLEMVRDRRGYSEPFALLGGVHVDDVGFGLLTQGAIKGFIWEDSDFNGQMDAGEEGLRGVTVTLVDAHDNETASRQTVRSGEFSFDQLMPGDYAICVGLPEGYAFTVDGAQSLAPHDAQADDRISVGTLNMGAEIADVRIGALKTASVSGVVWLDQDDDGRRQNGDQGMEGVRAVLEMTNGADAGKTYESYSDSEGVYRFDGLLPGEALITFELEDGYAFAKRVSGTRRVSSVDKTDAAKASTEAFSISSGVNRMDMDVGVVGVGTVSGLVWEDVQYDGRCSEDEPRIRNALAELVDTASGEVVASAITDAEGMYVIDFARKGEYRVRITLPDGRIFTRSGASLIEDVDSDTAKTETFTLAMGESVDGQKIGAIVPAVIAGRVIVDENENGVCDEADSGLEGAVVTAMQGGTVVATAYADTNGEFAFDTLRPGTYRLRYVLDDETLFAHGVQLNMTDADAMDAETSEYTLEMGQRVNAQDVSVVRAARIAGKAWMDENVSGSMDEGEKNLAGVTAQLLGGDGSVLAQVTTGSDGSYAFERLRSGSYTVRFAMPDHVLFTDCTGNPGGSCVPVMTGSVGETDPIILDMGEEKADMHVGGILPGRIGDTVWYDKDGNGLQDYKEPLLPGVSLTLLYVGADGAMTETATVTSDEYGYFSFDALRPGTYVMRLNAQEGDSLTSCFGAPLGEIDNDIDPDTLMSRPIELQSGQTLRNIDVGLTEHAN